MTRETYPWRIGTYEVTHEPVRTAENLDQHSLPPCYDIPEPLLSPRARRVFALVGVMGLVGLVLGVVM